MVKRQHPGALPSRDEILQFIRESDGPVGRRELARAFNLKGAAKSELGHLLKELKLEGLIEGRPPRGDRPRRRDAGRGLPEVAVLIVEDRDVDGELLARPVAWSEATDGPPPRIYLAPDKPGRPSVASGQRLLARLRPLPDGSYEASPMRLLGGMPRRVLGVYETGGREGGRLHPTDKRLRQDFLLRREDAAGAENGEFVLCEVKPQHRRFRDREVRVLERLGHVDSPRAISLIAIHEHDLPHEFPQEAVEEAEAAGPTPAQGRVDLRDISFVTIDGADARDFDDAVWAARDEDPENPGGWKIRVAIADVAHYVRPSSPLDKEAYKRGNSVYFPDRVVPMLPEALSNGWCSLRPNEDRGCLAVEMTLDKGGRLLAHRFERGLMRSRARLTYEQVQAARDGRANEATAPLLEEVIMPLYGAFEALLAARKARGTLDLDIAEKAVEVDEDGKVVGITPRERLDSHRLIEEFMIAANVAAAEALEALGQPCMYRVHEPPDPARVEALRETLASFGLSISLDQMGHPRGFSKILETIEERPEAAMLNQLVLRCQSQAYYGPENKGHFGLALQRYAHFTSPIRRYADLLVHRALIDGLKLGRDGLSPEARESFAAWGEHISLTERQAQAAERDAVDRFVAVYLKDRVGAEMTGRVGGVTRFGLFVTLDETGADGLVPIGSLPDDYYDHVEEVHALVGRRWGRSYHLGDRVRVRLAEVEPVTGGIVMQLVEVLSSAAPEGPIQVGDRGPKKGARRKAAKASATTRAAERKRKRGAKAERKKRPKRD